MSDPAVVNPGMTLVERWSTWRREPFTSDSVSHISVWQRSRSREHVAPEAPPG
jgi:hypothetical protein